MTFKKIRTGMGIAVILGIAIAAFSHLNFGSLCYLHIGMTWMVCPVGFFEICLNNRTIYWSLLPFALAAIVLAVLLGRAFCSWICPVVFLGDWADRAISSVLPSSLNQWRMQLGSTIDSRVPKLTYKDGLALLAGALVAIAIFQYPFLSVFCPIGVVTRNIINLFNHLTVSGDLLFLLIPLIGGAFFVGGWRACCPTGLFHSLGAQANRVLVPSVDESRCTHCGYCKDVCSAGINLGEGEYERALCTKCFNCVDACPNGAVEIDSPINRTSSRNRTTQISTALCRWILAQSKPKHSPID